MLHWASLIIFFGLSVLALWVAHSFLEKNGLYFFCIVASIVSAYFAEVGLFGKVLSIQMVVLPSIFMALYLCYTKYGNKESIRLFIVTLFSQITMFVLRFFEYNLLDLTSGKLELLSWSNLNNYVATIVAFLGVCIGAYFFVEYVKMESVPKILRTSIYIGLFSIVDSLLYIVVAYSGLFSFVDMLLTFLLCIALNVITALLLGCVEYLVTYKRKPKDEKNKEDKQKAVKQEEKNQKLSSYFNKKDETNLKSTTTKPSYSSQTTSKLNTSSTQKPSSTTSTTQSSFRSSNLNKK